VRSAAVLIAVAVVAGACAGGGSGAATSTAPPAGAATATAAPPPLTVTIGQVGGISDAAIYIGQAKGYFAEQGITLDSTSFTTAALMVAPLVRGDLMVGGGASGSGLFNAIRTGTAMRIVADKGNLNPGHGYEAIVVRSAVADQIKGPKDLRGRNVALSARDITPEVTLDAYLRSGGLTIKDVNVVVIPHAQMLAGFQTGAIDAGLPIEPYVTSILDSGAARLLIRDDAVTPNHQTAVIFYSDQFAKQRDAAVRFMVAYLRGARFYADAFEKNDAAKRAEAIDILAKATKFDAALLARVTMPGLDPNGRVNMKSLGEVQDYLVAKGTQGGAIDMAKVVDLSFADAAVIVLGPHK